MKKIFSKILIAILILGFLFAPVTPKIDIQNHFSLVKNEVFAEDIYYYIILAVDGIKSVEKTTLNLCQEARDENLKSGTSVKTPCLKATSRAEIDAKIAEIKTETTQQEITEINKTYDGVLGDNFFNCEASTIFTNCLVAGLYHVVFSLSAFLASLSARILDYFVFYALDSDSYKGDFVTLGWVLVRDISNILFIIALLYVAGKTVLGLNASNNKKIISMVILMALLINFSLFITKVVIDISNIVARVFYANIENVDQDGNQNVSGYSDADGTTGKSISVGLVAQFDPQNIFQNSGIPQLVDGTVGPFAIFLILSIILMFYMTYMFLSVAFVFIGRVAMLWILMIFSPLAFVSNTVPDFKIPKFNFREWKSELFNQAFLAPIFVFFLYLIISFGKLPIVKDVVDPNTLNNVGGTATNGTLNTVMKIFIPFIIIFTLVKVAKDTTIKMAGDLGKGLSNVGPALGSLALGAVAAGTAMVGRSVIGGTLAKASRGETLSQRYAANDTASMKGYQKFIGRIGNATGFASAYGNTKNADGVVISGLGGRINKAQGNIFHTQHARHDMDAAMKAAHLEGRNYNTLTVNERKEIEKQFTKIKKSEIKEDLVDGRIKLQKGTQTFKGESDFTGQRRNDIAQAIIRQNASGNVSGGALTDQGKKLLEDRLKKEFKSVLEKNIKTETNKKYNNTVKTANTKISRSDSIMSMAPGATYDIRNFNPVSDKKSNILTKTGIFLLGAIAANLRSGLKVNNLNPGKGIGDITKDLSSIISSSVKAATKDMKFEIKGGDIGDGHGGGHDDHGGGHGGGHH